MRLRRVPRLRSIAPEPAMTAMPSPSTPARKRPSSAAAASGASKPCSTSSPACGRSSRATPAAATPNPTYDDVCSGRTGHAEVVRVTFDPSVLSFRDLLTVFFTIHDPTTKDRQGNDVGTQYRSVIFCQSPEQRATAESLVRGAHGGEAVEGSDRHRDRRRRTLLRGRALPPGILRAAIPRSPIARSSSRPRSRSSASTSPNG